MCAAQWWEQKDGDGELQVLFSNHACSMVNYFYVPPFKFFQDLEIKQQADPTCFLSLLMPKESCTKLNETDFHKKPQCLPFASLLDRLKKK